MTSRPGRRNLITDVDGIAVGNAHDARAWTGVTVVVPDRPVVAAVSVAGGAPGTSDTDLLRPSCFVERIHAIVLSGGSVFGLDAVGGVTATLLRRKRGYRVGPAVIPIVPGAVLFDLRNGGDKSWGERPPYRRLAAKAASRAGRDFALGNFGAGYGARAGSLKGGLGSASWASSDGLRVGAIAAVNSQGSVLMPGTPHFWAAPLEQDGEFGGHGWPERMAPLDLEPKPEKPALPATNTTIAVVAANAELTKAEAERVAIMAQDGLTRAIRPVHTPSDGDTVFALATGRWRARIDPAMLARIGALAADCLSRAVARGVYAARDLGAWRAYRSVWGAQ